MARFNEILVGRYNRFLQKLLVLKGGPPSPQLSSEIGSFFQLFNGAENRYLESWNRYANRIQTAAVAAQNSVVNLVNVPNTNVIGVIEKITVMSSLADQPTLALSTNTSLLGGGVNPNIAMDRRQGSISGGSVLQASQNNNVATFQPIGQVGYPANTSVEFLLFEEQEFVLTPGYGLFVQSTAVNVVLTVSFIWRERFLEESERS
jgi:hypothetical protein